VTASFHALHSATDLNLRLTDTSNFEGRR
jgi:hypothetical protein